MNRKLFIRQLPYDMLAKVDGLFSPSYTQLTFASLFLIDLNDF